MTKKDLLIANIGKPVYLKTLKSLYSGIILNVEDEFCVIFTEKNKPDAISNFSVISIDKIECIEPSIINISCSPQDYEKIVDIVDGKKSKE